jgi:hypothetical protein
MLLTRNVCVSDTAGLVFHASNYNLQQENKELYRNPYFLTW